MRILIISHNVIGDMTNMGKTMMSYFDAFGPEEVYQFYIQSEVPVSGRICQNYYRFTDRDAIKSLFRLRRYGTVIRSQDIARQMETEEKTGITRKLYHYGKKRTPAVFLLRNLLWKLAKWDTKEFRDWLREAGPDLICFVTSDYSFMYKIAGRIAKDLEKPMAAFFLDDFYLFNKNHNSFLGKTAHGMFRKSVQKTMQYTCGMFAICDSMRNAYERVFHKPCFTLHTAAEPVSLKLEPGAKQISYIGNLIGGRAEQLAAMGRAVKKKAVPEGPGWIDVYSTETDPKILAQMSEDNGIHFHGAIPPEEVKKVMARSMAVIHVESFDETIRQHIRYSVSTKIAESLVYGPCLIAYGPLGIASIDYLRENGAAFVISSEAELEEKLGVILTDPELRKQILERARRLGYRNHLLSNNSVRLREQLTAFQTQNG